MNISPAEAASTTGTRLPAARARDERSPRVLHAYRAIDDFRDLDKTPLSHRECAELTAWHDQRRRRAWLAGRTVAKRLIADLTASLQANGTPDPPRIEILSRDAQGRVNRPRVLCGGIEKPWSLSVSHSTRGVLVAVTASSDVVLGVDLVDGETFSNRFVELWFTEAERAWFKETQSSGTARFIWAAKEALYKACNNGEPFVPRDVEVLSDRTCTYRGVSTADYPLRSWTIDRHLAVMAMVRPARLTHSIHVPSP